MPEPNRDRAAAIAKIADRLGQYGLPLAVGLFFGYWTSDFGVAWLPSMLELLSVVLLISLLLIFAGRWQLGKLARDGAEGQKLRRRIAALMVLALVAIVVRLGVYWARQPSPLTELDPGALRITQELDGQRLADLHAQMSGLLTEIEALGLEARPADAPLDADDEAVLREVWSAFYDTAFAVEQIRIFHEDWFRFDPSRAQRQRLLRSYLLTFGAELSLFEHSLDLVDLIDANGEARRFLDAPHPEAGLPSGTFGLFRQEFLGTRDQARVVAGEHYLRWLESTLGQRGLLAPSSFPGLFEHAWSRLNAIRNATTLERLDQTLRADTQLLGRTVRRTWYPTQKGIADWMGDTKTRRIGRYLIEAEQVAAMVPHLQPGDVLLSRKNWYLSNVGLPGFWPHAVLYIGDPEQLRSHFDSPEVRQWAADELGRSGVGLDDLLAKRHPRNWGRYLAGDSATPHLRGHSTHASDHPSPMPPVRVIEAISEGVVLNTLEGAAGDYLAALRPRLGPVARARAIAEAFSHLDKPYDFDFDFATDHALVCTEVVWRSYRPREGQAGLELPVGTLAGRTTLPANAIARLYAEEHGRPDAQFDFVYFLDAREEDGAAHVADEAAFRASHRRFKWDLLLE